MEKYSAWQSMESIAPIGIYRPSIGNLKITQEISYDQGEIAGQQFQEAISKPPVRGTRLSISKILEISRRFKKFDH
jgi:hypothetical protein